jgi:L-ribulose-5-phosphate 4-epimerase
MLEVLKEKVVVLAKEMLIRQLTDGTSGNISMIDRKTGAIVITPSSMPYNDMTSDQICVLDKTGKLIEGGFKPSSEWQMHLGAFTARKEINCVMHTHSRYLIALACTHTDLPAITVDMAAYCGAVAPVVPYRTPGTEELASLVTQELTKGYRALLLANHGSLVVGPDEVITLEAGVALELAAMAFIRGYHVAQPVPIPEGEVNKLLQLIYGESTSAI